MMILETMIHPWATDAQVVMQTSKCIIKLAILQLGRLTNRLPGTLKSLQKGADTWIEPQMLRYFDTFPSTTQAFSTAGSLSHGRRAHLR